MIIRNYASKDKLKQRFVRHKVSGRSILVPFSQVIDVIGCCRFSSRMELFH